MEHDTLNELLASLDKLLDLERTALVSGELDQLGSMTDEKERLVVQINASVDLTPEQLEPLHRKVTRNQALLNSALDGIRSVANRMAELRRVRQGLETYDSAGQKHRFSATSSSQMEKRA